MAFSGPDDLPLQVGRYEDAARHPFNAFGTPGMDVFGNGRGDNVVSGFFEVLEIEYGQPSGIFSLPEIEKLAIDYVQFDEGDNSKWMVGSFRFNSALPVQHVPEPSTLGLLAIGLTAFAFRNSQVFKHTDAV